MRGRGKDPELAALLIAPDRELAQQLQATLAETRSFQVLSELKAYPSPQTLDLRLRQVQPDVVLLDVSSNLEAALDLIRSAAAVQPPVHVVAIHTSQDSSVVIKVLRAGAHEFLSAPFAADVQKEAALRIRRLREPAGQTQPEFGRVVAFSSAKPGSGASTLAIQTAFSLRRYSGKRVLLVDLDLHGGSIAFNLKINSPYSVLDALERSDQLDPAIWSSIVSNASGVDVLPGPDVPGDEELEPNRLHEVLEYARMLYDWVVIDLPAIFNRLSLFLMSESDQCLLVATSELPSLHLARRAVGLLSQLGFERERYQMIINRLNKKDGITGSDLEKVLGCKLFAVLPNDYYALHRVVTRAEPLQPESELGRAMESVAARIAGHHEKEKRTAGAVLENKPVLSET